MLGFYSMYCIVYSGCCDWSGTKIAESNPWEVLVLQQRTLTSTSQQLEDPWTSTHLAFIVIFYHVKIKDQKIGCWSNTWIAWADTLQLTYNTGFKCAQLVLWTLDRGFCDGLHFCSGQCVKWTFASTRLPGSSWIREEPRCLLDFHAV
jgi:hypothetical protein